MIIAFLQKSLWLMAATGDGHLAEELTVEGPPVYFDDLSYAKFEKTDNNLNALRP